jgi:uncharacterized protein YbjT (DUF2867 family)
LGRTLIAGASGFIGRALIEQLPRIPDQQVVAFSRRPPIVEGVESRAGDLFSPKDITAAMEGCDQAVYLVHSMLPSASLVQGQFYDLDLILADNFARAARRCGVKHVLYLGGIVPDTSTLSWHLKSRLEVEKCLQAAAPQVTVLRAGMVLGAGGSSFTIMRRLVERLPMMACPSWTATPTQPIDLRDLLAVMINCLTKPTHRGQIWDVGGPETITYYQMLEGTARALNQKPRMFPVPAFSPTVSRWWVTLVTGAPRELVYPLVQSLQHSMVVSPARRFPETELTATTFTDSLEYWLSHDTISVHAFEKTKPSTDTPKDVRSVQRLPLPAERNAEWVAHEYFRWLPQFFSSLILVRFEAQRCAFYLFHPRFVLLELTLSPERSTPDRQLLYITGGFLALPNHGRGRLEFREVLEGRYVLSAIHEFRPALPWIIYKWTQAIVHLMVMNAFARHLRQLREK